MYTTLTTPPPCFAGGNSSVPGPKAWHERAAQEGEHLPAGELPGKLPAGHFHSRCSQRRRLLRYEGPLPWVAPGQCLLVTLRGVLLLFVEEDILVVGGDGRYYSDVAAQKVIKIARANGVSGAMVSFMGCNCRLVLHLWLTTKGSRWIR